MKSIKQTLLRAATAVPITLMMLTTAPTFAQSGDPPPPSVTDKTEVLDSHTEKIPNSITNSGGYCDKITRHIKVTPQMGEPMSFTETLTLCPNAKQLQMPFRDEVLAPDAIYGSSSMTQYAPAPSYTCSLGQGMGSGWTTDTTATWWLWYSYYNASTSSYGTFPTSLNGYTYGATTFTSHMGSQYNIRYYAVRFDTSPAAIQSGNGTWCD